MIDSTKSRKQLWNRSSIYGHLLVIALLFVCIIHVNSSRHDAAITCSESRTCTKCAEKPSCSWSLRRQTCLNTAREPEPLTVNIRADCPHFSAVDSFVNDTHLPVKSYKVKVSNDVTGFVKYLAKSNITCSLNGVTYNGTANGATDTIECASTTDDQSSESEPDERRLTIYRNSIVFNDVTLCVDDGANNYLAVYNGNYCDVANKNKDCAACSWDSGPHTFYYKRCSVGNACTGLFEYYDGDRTSGARDDAAAGACPEMAIRSVEPPSAPWSGGVTLAITVGNHGVLAESREVSLTVAGRDCVHPKTLNGETVSCTVGPPGPGDSAAGPVRVTYGPLQLTSTETFRFVYPEPTAVSPACGPVAGGTLLRITGRSLDAGSAVTVSVGPADVPCELVARYEDRVLCVTGPSAGPSAAGPVTVVFDKSLRLTVGANGTARFAYAGDPVLDERQPFSGIASGGTYVPVHGRHLACIGDASLYVDDPDGVRHHGACVVRNDTFMECRSPAVGASPFMAAVSTLNFGFRVRFAGHAIDLSPQPDYPGYRMYADPVFTDFETDGRNVTINGRRLDKGYRPSADLTIRLRNANGALCTVVDTQRRRIVCVRPAAADGDLGQLHVSIGHEFVRTVLEKKNDLHPGGVPSAVFGAFLVLVGVLIGVSFVLLLVAAIYFMWYNKTCDIRRYL